VTKKKGKPPISLAAKEKRGGKLSGTGPGCYLKKKRNRVYHQKKGEEGGTEKGAAAFKRGEGKGRGEKFGTRGAPEKNR